MTGHPYIPALYRDPIPLNGFLIVLLQKLALFVHDTNWGLRLRVTLLLRQ